VLVMEVAQVGAVFNLGLQVGVCMLGFASYGIQVGVFKSVCGGRGVVNSWFPSFDGGSLPTTSR
jgi:hypothetical protein